MLWDFTLGSFLLRARPLRGNAPRAANIRRATKKLELLLIASDNTLDSNEKSLETQ